MYLFKEQRDALISRLAAEGQPRFLTITDRDAEIQAVPEVWRQLLSGQAGVSELVDLLWSPVRETLPSTIAAVARSLQGVECMVTESRGPSLIYVFTKGGQLRTRRGFTATSTLPPIRSALSVDLTGLYAVHDGWFDLFSYDTGWLPTQEWAVIGGRLPEAVDGFLQIFRSGSNSLGFDLSENPSLAYSLWGGEEEVEEVDQFWVELDGWMAHEIEQFDTRLP